MDGWPSTIDHRPALERPALETTWFAARWREWAARRGLPHDPLATAPAFTVATLRREALEFFSWGCVHQAVAQQRLEELLGERGERSEVRGQR